MYAKTHAYENNMYVSIQIYLHYKPQQYIIFQYISCIFGSVVIS